MHLKTLVILFLGVALLGGVALWQLREEEAQRAKADASLLEGFDRGRVKALRIDNLERSLQMRIERTPAGEWSIVDPVEFPAEVALIEALLAALETQRLKPPLVLERDKVRLAPPRAVLEISEDVGGRSRTTRIEVGEVDIGGQWVYVSRDGELGRTERALDTLLERDLPDWRSHFVMSFDPRSVVEVSRQGRVELEHDAPLQLELQAVLDGEWRATAPFVAQLDPRMVSGMIQALAGLRADAFIDAPGPLEYYGLALPSVRLEVVDARGRTQALRMAPEPQGEMWYATREDQPYVYRVSSLSAGLCFPPTEGLVDLSLARVARGDLQRVEFAYEGRSVTLGRGERGWRVTGREGERVVLHEAQADDALVSDALAVLEQARLEHLYFERQLEPDEIRGHLRLEAQGATIGGVLGPPQRTADGVEGVLFRRDGDQLVGLLPQRLLELVRRDAGAFQSLLLHKVLELEVSYIEVERGGARRRWVRDEHGHWVRQGMHSEAKEFARLVDRLLSMRASGMLVRGDEELLAPLNVEIGRYSGQSTQYTLGRARVGDAESFVYRTGSQFATIGAEPYSSLLPLLEGD